MPAFNVLTRSGGILLFQQPVAQPSIQGFLQEGRFSGARDAGYTNQAAQGKIYANIFQVVGGGTLNPQALCFLCGPKAR